MNKIEIMHENSRGGVQTASPRLGYIDALKGIGIICVVIGHVAQSYVDSHMLSEADWLLHAMLNATYCFHMPFFFIISGFLYFHSYFTEMGLPRYDRLKKQFGNLLWIYVLFSVLYGIYRIVFSRFANERTTVLDILLIGIHPLGVYWYLHTLLLLYLLFMIPRLVQQKAWILLCITGATSLVGFFAGDIPFLESVIVNAFYFTIGLLLARSKRRLSPCFLILTASAAVVLITVRADLTILSESWMRKTVVALGCSFGLWILFESISAFGDNQLLKLCGKHSMEIYVIHTFSTSGCRGLLPLLHIHGAYISILLNFVISISIPFFVVWITKKLHLYDLIFRPMKLRNTKSDIHL